MLTRAQKEEIVAKLEEKIAASPSAVILDFKGVGAKDMDAIKDGLRESGSTLQVVKKSLLKIAFDNQKVAINPRDIDGQIAVAFSADEVTGPKIVHEAGKENENIKILGGLLDHAVISDEEVIALAKLPSKEELYGKVVGVMVGPIRAFVGVGAGVPRSFVQVLKAIAEQKSA